MSNILLRDILISARQESVQMRHHYIGVEHLFVALLTIQGGLASGILETQGLTTEYVIDAIRRKMDKGTPQRLWAGIPYTPRAEIILDIANDMVLDNGSEEITERELLNAIIIEGDSLPIRVLKTLNININALEEHSRTYTPAKEPHLPNLNVTFSADFDRRDAIQREHLFILRRMFSSHASIRVERRLTGFRDALILVVTPIHADGREDASVVAKIDMADNILDEVQRYEAHVKNAAPLQAARLEDSPTVPESSDLAGIKYTLVAGTSGVPQDLRNRVQLQGTIGLGELIKKELYTQFNKAWWQQRRAFRFQVWQEYDWLLPPVLTLDYVPDRDLPPNTHLVKVPINRARLKTKLHEEIQFGDEVILENFTVHKVDRANNVLKLAIGYGSEADKRAYRIDVRGLNLSQTPFYRGEVVERLVGKVWKTRHEMLLDAARDLEPDFDLRGRWITIGDNRIPNPLLAYEDLLDRHVNGSVSRIHGDLHMGNVLIGPNNTMWLIDFGHTRDGHTLFDWANLEISLLGDALMSLTDGSWATANEIVQYVAKLDSENRSSSMNAQIDSTMNAVAAVREIVQECLTVKDNWYEYYVALSLCALRGITFKSMTIGGRRLMFLMAGMALLELNRKYLNNPTMETPSPDATELTDHLPTVVSADRRADTLDRPTPSEEFNALTADIKANDLKREQEMDIINEFADESPTRLDIPAFPADDLPR